MPTIQRSASTNGVIRTGHVYPADAHCIHQHTIGWIVSDSMLVVTVASTRSCTKPRTTLRFATGIVPTSQPLPMAPMTLTMTSWCQVIVRKIGSHTASRLIVTPTPSDHASWRF